jgi:hypothetical protein
MKPDRKVEADKIEILGIRTLKGSIDAQTDAATDKIAGYKHNYEVTAGLNIEEKIVGYLLGVQISAVDKEDIPLNIEGSYTHEIIFRVGNLDELVDITEGDHIIDAGLGSTLISIAYSTIRGIIFSRTQGTSLGLVILPVIDPKILMTIIPEANTEAK